MTKAETQIFKSGIFRFFECLKKKKSLVLTAVDRKLIILMGIRDQVRAGVKQDLQKLKITWC